MMPAERIVEVCGTPILAGEATGLVSIHPKLDRSGVLVAPNLTTDVALLAISEGAVAVLTEEGSFACHAANMLRAHNRDTGASIVWISHIVDAVQILCPGTRVHVHTSGVVGSPDIDRISSSSVEPTAVNRFQAPRDIHVAGGYQDLDLRCYWPHRHYDRLTASIMSTPLAADLRDLTGLTPRVLRDDNGRLWFTREAPSTDEIASIALDPKRARSSFDRQCAVYLFIDTALREASTAAPTMEYLDLLLDLLRRYFGAFFLYHATYEHVLSEYLASHELDGADFLLTSWIAQEKVYLRNRKDLLDEPNPIPMPPFRFSDDLHGDLTWQNDRNYGEDVLVLKEWKFFLNKAIFTRFAWTIRELLAATDIEVDDLRHLHVNAVRNSLRQTLSRQARRELS